MSPLSRHLEAYLAMRRRLGFKLRDAGYELPKFVRFAQAAKASFITTKLALEWATQPTGCQPAQWTARLGMVRRFAEYLSAVEPRTEVPPQGLLPHRFHRKTPYRYSDREVAQLIAAAQKLPSPKGLRAATYSTLFGLLAVTGMRLGEALGLDQCDVDLDQGLLKVRQAKFNKSRWVPIHPTTQGKLQEYRRRRDRIFPHPQSPSFLLSERGTRLTGCVARYWFIRLSHQIGLRRPTDHQGPRIHDLRHRFVIRTLRHWYRTNKDVEAHLPELATYIGHGHVSDTYWYISATPELLQLATERLERKHGAPLLMKTERTFAVLLQAYFTERLVGQRNASPHTIASHRDTFRLLLSFAQKALKKAPADLALSDLDAPFIGRFPDHVEKDRGNKPQTRNIRLAAIHSFFHYVALQEPGLSALAQRVLTIPSKRHKTKPVDYLTREEINALVPAPDQSTWAGRRDRTLLLLAAQTGLRASELIGLRCQDVVLGTGAHVCCLGKGRKERCTPLRKDAAAALRHWLPERNAHPSDVVFPNVPNAKGSALSRDGLAYLLAKHLATARLTCFSLKAKRVSPMCLGTAWPWSYSSTALTAQSSRFGWAMSPWKRPRFSSMRISPSRSKRWPKPIRSRDDQAAIGPETSS